MDSRRRTGHAHASGDAVDGDVSRGHPRWRRWALLVAVAAGLALVCAWLVVVFAAPGGERSRLKAAIGEVASQLSPDSADLLREVGGAVDHLLQQFSESGETLRVVAAFYEGLGRTKDAVRCWQQVLELDPALGPTAHAAIGSIAYQGGQLDTAAEHFRLAMQQDAQSTAYPVQLAEVLIQQGRFQETVELLEGLLKMRPRMMTASVLLGQAYLRLNVYDKARQHLETGVEMGPDYSSAYFGLATACARLGDEEKSKEYRQKFKELQAQWEQRHREVLKAASGNRQMLEVIARAYTAVGEVYITHGDYQAAEAQLRRAGEVDVQAVQPRVTLAWLYEEQGQVQKSLRVLTELRERAPRDLGAQMSLGAAYARLRQFDDAEAAYRRAVELTPQSAGGYVALTHFYLQTGRKLEQASVLAQQAVELEPAAEHYYLLSLARRAHGDLAGAVTAIDQAMALAPDNREYPSLARELRGRVP